MKAAKLGAIFLISIMALAGTSAGYALWSETLTIDGTITTGDVDVEWSYYGYEIIQEKEISTMDVTFSENTMTVTILNAYPCVWYYVYFDIHCVGSIPVHFGPWTIIEDLPADATFTLTDFDYETTQTQLHTCEFVDGILEIHLENDATELTTYTFTATITAYQYNEYP